MPPAYVVAISGGLGNQLFQYAVGRALSQSHGADLLFDKRPLEHGQRPFMLDRLQVVGELVEGDERLPPRWTPLTRRMPWLLRIAGVKNPVVESQFTFDQRILNQAPPAFLWGNWQSEKYFRSMASMLRAEIRPKAPLTASRQSVARSIVSSLSVSVHVRRGDYVSSSSALAYHGTCEPAWYTRAKTLMDARASGAKYFVFSDDPHWARVNLPEYGSAVFVEPSADGRDEQDMHLMSLCSHHIIANSSFSWWGAWLNPRPDKLVIAPDRWFAGATHDTRDLIPSGWTRL